MSQTETAQVAADLTASMLGEAAAKFSGDPSGDSAVRMLGEMGQTDEAPQPVVSVPTPAAEAAPAPPTAVPTPTAPPPEPDVAPAPELPDFEPQFTEEYAALLEEPEFETEAAAEVAAEVEERGYDESFDQDAAARIRTLEKKNKWLEEQNVKANKGKWVAEAKRSFPLLATYAADELAAIEATSRRAHAREAAKLNERYAKVLAPALKDLAVAKETAQAEAKAAARQYAKEHGWGDIPGEPVGAATGTLSEPERALLAARERRAPTVDRLKILMNLEPRG